jgi:glutamate carboxypeptidase
MNNTLSPNTITRIQTYLTQQRQEMLALLEKLVLVESPSLRPESQAGIQSILQAALKTLDYEVERIPGQTSGGQLYAAPQHLPADRPQQLLIGHCDTVWPVGTLKEMPLIMEENIVRGPGVYDMKAGLVQMIYALKAIQMLQLKTAVTPLIFINSDEEIGSIESTPHIRRLAKMVNRAFILEPALGPTGKLKTARKGVGQYEIVVHGRAAHAGLDPEKGVSAILEMAHIIQTLFALNEPETGVSVNVGIIEGGLQPNVIAPQSRAVVDVRVPTHEDAARIEQAILTLPSVLPDVTLTINGRINRPPLERTPANQALWQTAQSLGQRFGLTLDEGLAGGGSDGNTTSLYTATLDGLGAVGDGAHARHEFIYIDKWLERCTLLALLLLSPPAEQ